MARYKNTNWSLCGNDLDKSVAEPIVQLALLMDIRDECGECGEGQGSFRRRRIVRRCSP